ncbi:hypothetical protein lerEdw1_005805 [Lerista edwardsae]|nr:hypothetical protein lerEdw1_005805 [Lerista edwardsae]
MLSPEVMLGLGLLLLLSPGFIASSRYLYSEVIVPRQLESVDTFEIKGDLSYIIKMEGNHRIIHLKKRSFIVSNMPVYSYNLKGVAIADYPYIQDDCYYSGYVEDSLDSQAVLSACTGLWGHVQIGNFRYEIEPIENSSTFQHLVYRRDPEHREPCRGVLVEGADLKRGNKELKMIDDDSQVPLEKSRDVHNFPHTSISYLEYYAVADKSKVYLDIGLHVYLVGLELWTERDYSTVDTTNLGVTLGAFYHYATSELQHRVHFDHAGIVTAKGSPAGLAWGDHFCLYNRASVSAVRAYGNLAFDAETIAHALGHSLGFSHDDTPGNKAHGCDCNCSSPGQCMMASGYITCRRLSNCSRRVYYDTIRKPGKECLFNVPVKVLRQKVCGNGVLEDDEECDCGRSEESSKNQDASADSQETKELTEADDSSISDAVMGTKFPGFKGPDFLEVGAACREAASECDLPEYCNGSSADCPPDVYKQDGMPCGSKDNCYAGKCLNLHQHCTDLFGKGKACAGGRRDPAGLRGAGHAKPAPLVCFKEVNIQGDQSGNCGQQGLKYKKCKEEDVLCGRVQCINVKNIPKMSTGQAIVQTPVERTWCWGTELHLGKGVCDLGAVKDGTACGSDKICINRSCVGVDVLHYDCDFKKCHNRGVCNSNRNCHCVYGWAPPFCEAKGYGGSIDSGPPPPYLMPVGLIVGIVTVVGLFLLALAFVGALKREKLQAWFASLTQEQISPEADEEEEEEEEEEDGSMKTGQSQSEMSVKSQLSSSKRSNLSMSSDR